MKKQTVIFILTTVLLFTDFSKSQSSNEAKAAKNADKIPSGPIVKVLETNINLGTIPRGQIDILGEIEFVNTGDEPLIIERVNGSCDCFSGYSGDQIVQPGEKGKIEVRFDKNKIPTGYAVRPLHLETNDPVNPMVDVELIFIVERDPIEEQLLIVNNELIALRKEVAALRNELNKAIMLLEHFCKTNEIAPGSNMIETVSSHAQEPNEVPKT